MKSYYDILGVTPDVTEDELKLMLSVALQKSSNDKQKMAVKRIYQVLNAQESRKNYEKALRCYNTLGLDFPVEEKQLQQAANKKLQATKEGSKQLLINRALEELTKNYTAYSELMLSKEEFVAVSKLGNLKKVAGNSEGSSKNTLIIIAVVVVVALAGAAFYFTR
ncbi:hypothetical protein BegalDRAFT_3057 [Beggiatoa alba B18LD]|uniref:Uncharacterized protein n=1 Tax=Beggiatoa alba B18LD TaxID=395493 RepID=I3CJU0_9GAMM|nr:hypothetical protein [Beggiatoa alba]EIJ43883.1 hypothetical protein BegalDRAFT_3057 [Beggiatoa alba B18LD]